MTRSPLPGPCPAPSWLSTEAAWSCILLSRVGRTARAGGSQPWSEGTRAIPLAPLELAAGVDLPDALVAVLRHVDRRADQVAYRLDLRPGGDLASSLIDALPGQLAPLPPHR